MEIELKTGFLDGTRFFLALWVAISHFNIMVANPFHIPNANSAVDGFIVITGFLMMYHYIKREKKESPTLKSTVYTFWLRRLFRLYPVYFLVIIIGFFSNQLILNARSEVLMFFGNITYDQWELTANIENAEMSIGNLFSHLTFLHGFIPSHVLSIVEPAWSLSLEMQFYFVFPILFLYFFRKSNKLKMTIFIIFTTILSIVAAKIFGLYPNKGIFLNYRTPSILLYKLPLFLLGMILASVGLKRTKNIYLLLSLLFVLPFQNKYTIVVISFIVSMVLLEVYKPFINKKIYTALDYIKTILSVKLFKVGADLSYSFYLLHILLMPLTILFTINIFHSAIESKMILILLSLILSLIINFIISFLIYNSFEKKFILMGKETIKKINNKKANLQNEIKKAT